MTEERMDHPKTPVRLLAAEARQALLDAALRRASLRGAVWPAVDVRPLVGQAADLSLHDGSLGLCVSRNWVGVPLAVVVDALLTEMEIRAVVEQTVAMLPSWARACLPGILRAVPQALRFERWELKLLQRWGLISGLHYDDYRRCVIWECTELLDLVVKEMEKTDLTTENTEGTEGEAGL